MNIIYENIYLFGLITGFFLSNGVFVVSDVRANIKRLRRAEEGAEGRMKRSQLVLFIAGPLAVFSFTVLLVVVIGAINAHRHISFLSLIIGVITAFIITWFVRRYVAKTSVP